MATRPEADQQPPLDPTSETRAIQYQEVPNNHLSPMGQVDDIGRFARGAGPERLTRWFRIGILLAVMMIAFVVIANLVG